MSFKLKITILGETYKSQGKTVKEALENFPLKWVEIKGAGYMVLKEYYKSKLVNTQKKLMSMPILRRIKVNKVALDLWAKRLS